MTPSKYIFWGVLVALLTPLTIFAQETTHPLSPELANKIALAKETIEKLHNKSDKGELLIVDQLVRDMISEAFEQSSDGLSILKQAERTSFLGWAEIPRITNKQMDTHISYIKAYRGTMPPEKHFQPENHQHVIIQHQEFKQSQKITVHFFQNIFYKGSYPTGEKTPEGRELYHGATTYRSLPYTINMDHERATYVPWKNQKEPTIGSYKYYNMRFIGFVNAEKPYPNVVFLRGPAGSGSFADLFIHAYTPDLNTWKYVTGLEMWKFFNYVYDPETTLFSYQSVQFGNDGKYANWGQINLTDLINRKTGGSYQVTDPDTIKEIEKKASITSGASTRYFNERNAEIDARLAEKRKRNSAESSRKKSDLNKKK